MKKLVSIITPTYNSEKYIEKTIKSVLSQTYENWEMIIIDDYSKDKTCDIVKEYTKNDKRIKLLKLPENVGPAKSRNVGIKYSKGDFIAFLDSDDIWEEDKLEKQLDFMIKNGYKFTFTDYLKVNEKDDVLKRINAPKHLTYRKQLYFNHIGTSTVIYDAKKLGKIYMPDLKKRQDYALWLRILREFTDGYGLNLPLTRYTVRKGSVSSNKFKSIKYNWYVYRKSEKFGMLRSLFYLTSNIVVKLLRIK